MITDDRSDHPATNNRDGLRIRGNPVVTRQNNGYLLRADQSPKRRNRPELFKGYAWCEKRRTVISAETGEPVRFGEIPGAFAPPPIVYGFVD